MNKTDARHIKLRFTAVLWAMLMILIGSYGVIAI